MNCREAGRLLSAYIDNDLDADRRQSLAEHLDSCHYCYTEKQALVKVVGMLHCFGRHNSTNEEDE